MGLTTWKGAIGPDPKGQSQVRKNYLSEQETRTLNLLVDQCLSFVEFEAQQRRTMSTKDWARKLDDYLKLNERDILTDAGRVSHELADERAGRAFETTVVRPALSTMVPRGRSSRRFPRRWTFVSTNTITAGVASSPVSSPLVADGTPSEGGGRLS